jgi:DNA-binding HxlR family transcriptional regulator
MLKVRRNKSPPPPPLCALSTCMNVIAGAWTPNIIWHLNGGPHRFNELRSDMPRISAKMLSTRLKQLQGRGVIVRHRRDTSPPSVEYELTELGARLIAALEAIVAVGHDLKTLSPGASS